MTGLRLKSLLPQGPLVEVTFKGEVISLPEGANLATALQEYGVEGFRQTPTRGVARSPFCMMGVCFDCLLEVDGVTRQSCMIEVRAGIDIRPARQSREGPYESL
ncbi:2Fe-2S iron-sulfur cluster protein [Shimia isoporae]|uniref:2Fe-2S iron-sulfur cluster protein n=1 Tax=Shimia isoporae TaxID=647720 RepID=A0A4R1N575_9RHOB|nr:(2Fe-2S)-binding protein [Shimia isoporae]TCL01220.1 2Fe-2S iron-sulfur cluster protein [Shimia isoporae]